MNRGGDAFVTKEKLENFHAPARVKVAAGERVPEQVRVQRAPVANWVRDSGAAPDSGDDVIERAERDWEDEACIPLLVFEKKLKPLGRARRQRDLPRDVTFCSAEVEN